MNVPFSRFRSRVGAVEGMVSLPETDSTLSVNESSRRCAANFEGARPYSFLVTEFSASRYLTLQDDLDNHLLKLGLIRRILQSAQCLPVITLPARGKFYEQKHKACVRRHLLRALATTEHSVHSSAQQALHPHTLSSNLQNLLRWDSPETTQIHRNRPKPIQN